MPSAVIETYRYNTDTQILSVRFTSGKVYNYLDVPLHVYLDMRATPYKGSFLNYHIKGKYAFEQIEPE